MATTRYSFTPESAAFPASNFPQLVQVDATRRRWALAFDASTDEACWWTFVAPQGLTGTPTAIVHYMMASGTSGSVRFEAVLEAVTPGDSVDLDASDSYDSSNSNGGSVPGTAGYEQAISITLTNADSIAAGDLCRLKLNRDADGSTGTDDATGDAYVLAVEFRDAA